MSQYSSRIHIKVSSPDVWRRFDDANDAGLNLTGLADEGYDSFTYDSDWSCTEEEIDGIVRALAETIGTDGFILGDTTNINVDPYNYCVFSLGDGVRSADFGMYSNRKLMEMHFETDISDATGWLNYGNISVSNKEKKVLLKCGIAVITSGGKVSFESFITDFNIPNKVYLRETSFEGRPQIIEKTFPKQEVFLVPAENNEENVFLLEAVNSEGSLGYLPSDVGDQLAPLLSDKCLKYSAFVEEVVPLSKRNKHSKSPIVAIAISAEVKIDVNV